MTWDSSRHLRRPDGRFRPMNLAPGMYEYERGGSIHHYYVNDLNQLADGSSILSMSARGNVFGSFKDERPLERIHLMGTEDGELMAVSASERSTFGVVNHSKDAPPEAFSLNRGSKWQPVSENLPEGETAFGGRAAQLADRRDGKTYDTISALKAEEVNRQAFESPAARVFSASPDEFADAAVSARKFYQDKMGLDAKTAADMPVYVYVNGSTGELSVTPAYRGVNEDGTYIKAHSPNTKGGSASVKLRGADITRMARSMQDEKLGSVKFSISGGTNVSKTGKPLNNALHFRSDYENAYSHDSITMWGTVEQHNKGVVKTRAKNSFRRPDGTVDTAKYREYRKQLDAKRQEAAKPYANPTNPEQAARFLRRRYGSTRVGADDIAMRDGGRFALKGPHQNLVYDGSGKGVGVEINDSTGAAMYAAKRHPNNPAPSASDVSYNKGTGVYSVKLWDGTTERFNAGGGTAR